MILLRTQVRKGSLEGFQRFVHSEWGWGCLVEYLQMLEGGGEMVRHCDRRKHLEMTCASKYAQYNQPSILRFQQRGFFGEV